MKSDSEPNVAGSGGDGTQSKLEARTPNAIPADSQQTQKHGKAESPKDDSPMVKQEEPRTATPAGDKNSGEPLYFEKDERSTGQRVEKKSDGESIPFEEASKLADEWITFEIIEEPGGSPWPPIEAFDLNERIACLGKASVVLVIGTVPEYTQYAAEFVARHWLRSRECRRCSYEDLRYGYEEIINKLLLRPPGERCLVIGAKSHNARQIIRTRLNLKEAISGLGGKDFKLIYWLTQGSEDDFRDLEKVQFIELPATLSRLPAGSEPSMHFRRLFGIGVSDNAELIQAQGRLIEKTLVRVSVLFGPQLNHHLELLMKSALGDQTVRLPDAGDDGKGAIFPAFELWESNRGCFLERARMTSEGGRTKFISLEFSEAASEAAWQDSQAMASLFHRMDGVELLFGKRRDSDLLAKAMVEAASELVSRAHGTVDSDWVRKLATTFAVRYGGVTLPSGEPQTLRDALKAMLQFLRRDRDNNLHVRKRLGQLCNALPAEVSEMFIRDLIENDARPLAWGLLVEMRMSDVELGRCLRLLFEEEEIVPLSDGSDLVEQILRHAAYVALQSASDALALHRMFAGLLPDGTQEFSLAAKCALLLPVYCIWRLDSLADQDAILAMERLAEALDRPLHSGAELTLSAYWSRALSHPRIALAFDALHDDGKQWRDRALILFQLARTAPTVASDRFAALFQAIKRTAVPTEWRELRTHWQNIKAAAIDRRATLPLNRDNSTRRRVLADAVSACTRLAAI